MNTWQIIVVVSTIIGIIVWSMLMVKHKSHWRYGVAPMTYFAHLLIFYLFVYINRFDPIFLNGWSNALRLHGIILLVGIGISILSCRRAAQWKHLL